MIADILELNLLKNLIENRQEIYERLAPRVNIVDILGDTYYEVQNSKLLYYIFNTHFKYYDKEINVAKDLALYVVDKIYKDKIKDAKFENVYREFATKEGRRIDILIVFDKFEIIIENKINAREQENQLEDYYNDRYTSNKDIFVVYLTRYGYEAYSVNEKTKEELKDKIYCLSHGDIAEWIENDILNKYKFLKFDEKYQSIYSALIQIRDNEKIINNTNEDNNMEKEEIKNFLEENKYFGLLNNTNNYFISLKDCSKLLVNVQNVILNKRFELVSDDINYSLKVIEFIKNAQSNNGEEYMNGATFCSHEEIIRNVDYNNGYSRDIFIPIGNGGCSIWLEQHITYNLCISVYSENNDIINKLKEEQIKSEIGKIFDKDSNKDKYKEDEEQYYIYSLYIDAKKYSPKDIADKIIKLYEFLRDNINFDNA